jgi:hypothetical protein
LDGHGTPLSKQSGVVRLSRCVPESVESVVFSMAHSGAFSVSVPALERGILVHLSRHRNGGHDHEATFIYLGFGASSTWRGRDLGICLVNTPDFPAEYKPETLAGVEFLNVLRGEKELDWTFLSPSYFFAPGERTGKFRLGKDELLVAADGQSRISTEDFAIALVDELEQPKHSRQRFTVGY